MCQAVLELWRISDEQNKISVLVKLTFYLR